MREFEVQKREEERREAEAQRAARLQAVRNGLAAKAAARGVAWGAAQVRWAGLGSALLPKRVVLARRGDVLRARNASEGLWHHCRRLGSWGAEA